MKTVFSLTTLFYTILFSTPSFGQKITVPGFYISLQGDTVKGVFPAYSQWSKNPSEVEFIAGTSVEPTTLTPHNCKKFVVEGHDEYLAYTGQRLVNPIYNSELLNKRYSSFADEQQQVATFLRLVTRLPNFELYTFSDGKRTNLFYRLPGDAVVELRYKKYYDESQIKEIADYRNQLNNVFSQSIQREKLAATLKTLRYSEDAVKGFLEKLFPTTPVKHKQKNAAAGWVASVGASVNFVHLKAEKSFTYLPTEYHSSVSPLVAIGYIAPLRRNFGRYFLYPQLHAFRFKNTGEINDGTFRKVATYQSDLGISAEINGGVNLVNQQRIRFYLAGGLGMFSLVNNKRLDSKYLISQPSSEPYSSSETNIGLYAPPFVTASAGVVVSNRFLITAAYLLPATIHEAANYTPKYSAIRLAIGYKMQ